MNTKIGLSGLWKAIRVTLVLLIICGFIYPVLMTGLSKLMFPYQAGGSLIMVNDKAVGSELVGQDFTDPRFMKCRPSAVNYNTYTAEEKETGEYGGVSSGSNNYGASNPDLAARVEADMAAFLETHPGVKKEDIPTDLMTASGSGLDPHISPASAAIQIPALMEATGLDQATLEEIVSANTEGKVVGIFGENRVNVLKINLNIAEKLGILN